MKKSGILLLAALLIPSIGLLACESKTPKPKTESSSATFERSSGQLKGVAGRVSDDSLITTKARWALASLSDLHDIDISVKTVQGKVILSGTVWSVMDLRRVAAAVGSVEGVRQVENRITVKFLI